MGVEIRRGQIWMHELAPPDERRPVLILSRQESIRYLHQIVVAPITSAVRGGPAQVLVGAEVGLKGPSAATLHNLTAVHKSDLRRYVGTVSVEVMDAVCRAVGFALGCGDYASLSE